MPAVKIKRGDQVVVIAGKDVGAQGRVLEVIPKKRRVIVEGVNRNTRHEKIRMNRRGAQEGGITHKEGPIHISNVAVVCPTDGHARLGYRIDGSGAKIRICKKCGVEV
jgi:large subunit ribosomal protein L24